MYYVTMQITLPIPEFTRNERNFHCDVLHGMTRSQRSRRRDKVLYSRTRAEYVKTCIRHNLLKYLNRKMSTLGGRNGVEMSESESESELFYSANIQHSITMVMYKKKKKLMLAWRLLLRPITGRYHRATRRNKNNGSQVVASVIMNTDLT